MSATNSFETSILQLLFENTNFASFGTAIGLQGSTTAGVFEISLHTAALGETSTQTTTESAYSNYARVQVARGAAQWTVTGNTADNDNAITFATCGATGSSVTDFGIGQNSIGVGAGYLYLYGALTATLSISNGITPSFAAGALDTTLD